MNNVNLGVALVGLGNYSSRQLAPALKETAHCRLAGIVTGSREKARNWQNKYDIPERNIYNYENFDAIKDNKDIDIVYVVLPNSMHAEYTIRAAKAGKHVICEKPMAITVNACHQMIAACKEAGRKLSIGYRLQFEPHNIKMMDLGQNKKLGEVRRVTARHGRDIEAGVWRLNKALAGGGPLVDMGIYCVQGACYVVGEDPLFVMATEGTKTDTEKFKSVEQSLAWTLEFPSGAIASCACDYSKEMNLLRAETEEGWFELQPAYEYSGIIGKTSEGDLYYPQINQQAAQIDDFALCILKNKEGRASGELGLRDVKIMQAIYQSMRTGKRVEI